MSAKGGLRWGSPQLAKENFGLTENFAYFDINFFSCYKLKRKRAGENQAKNRERCSQLKVISYTKEMNE